MLFNICLFRPSHAVSYISLDDYRGVLPRSQSGFGRNGRAVVTGFLSRRTRGNGPFRSGKIDAAEGRFHCRVACTDFDSFQQVAEHFDWKALSSGEGGKTVASEGGGLGREGMIRRR